MLYSAHQKLKTLSKVLKEGKSVSEVCREEGIARKTFYQWKKKYQQAPARTKKQALESNYASGKRHPKSKRHKLEDNLISIIVHHPSWGSRKISAVLDKYKYKISNHAIYNLLRDLNLETSEKREIFAGFYQTFTQIKKIYKPKPIRLTAETRKRMIEEVAIGKESVSNVCRRYHTSRKTFYKWLARYHEAREKEAAILQAMQDDYVKGYAHPRSISEVGQEKILQIVIQHPEYSTHTISQVLPGIGNHGVQNILRRHNLSTYEARLAYQKARLAVKPVFLPVPTGLWPIFNLPLRYLRMALSPFATVPKRPAFRVFGLFFLSTFLLSNLAQLYLRISAQVPLENRFGLIFASVSLICGTFFFIYSLKYYLTVAIVLGFSRHVGEPEGNGQNNNGNGFFNGGNSFIGRILKALGGNNNGGGGRRGYGGGLQPDLERTKLERSPFVSIHLAMYNEKKVVNRLLNACTSMDYQNYEVVIVDDSTDETVEILKDWENHPKVKIIHRQSRTGFKGGALKVALENSDPRTEFVLVFDADFIPYPDTITQFLKYFQSVAGTLDFSKAPEHLRGVPQAPNRSGTGQAQHHLGGEGDECKIAAIQGYQWHVLNKSENWITRGVRSEYAGSYVVERSGGEATGALKQIAGSVFMVRADLLRKFGWGTSITEDFQLTLRLYEQGYKVIYTPYIQVPSECVSTIKRLVRQRMRWAEGHSHNIKRMFFRLMFGRWESISQGDSRGSKFLISNYSNYSKQAPNPNDQKFLGQLDIRSIRNSRHEDGVRKRVWVPSRLTFTEKLEFLYLSPYYLQAFFFMIGTLSWFISETIFKARLPFWTSLWGWSLVFTNLFSLPLLNTVGLFLEESEEKDYLGIISFVVFSYILAPFQAYASVKGFLESQEGPWFRTPKTGKVTDIIARGRFYRWIRGILPWRMSSMAQNMMGVRVAPVVAYPELSPYLSLATANNQLANFKVRPKRMRFLSKTVLAAFLIISVTILSLTRGVPEALADNPTGPFYLANDDSTVVSGTNTWKLLDNSVDSSADSTTNVFMEGFEFYKGSNTSQGTSTSATYSSHTSVTVDRSTKSGAKDFLVLAHIVIQTDSATTYPKVTLVQDDTTTLGLCDDGLAMKYTQTGETGHGLTFHWARRVNLSAASHSVAVQFARLGGTGTIYAVNSSVVVMEITSSTEYAEQISQVSTGTNYSNWETALSLTFSASAGNYIFIWNAEFSHDDIADPYADIRFFNATGVVTYSEANTGDYNDIAANSGKWFTAGGVVYANLTAGSKTLRIDFMGSSAADDTLLRRGVIVAIPFSDFANVYSDSQITSSFHGATFTDTTVSISQSVSAADHLVIGSVEVGNEQVQETGSWQLVADTASFPLAQPDTRDSDVSSPEAYQSMAFYGYTATAGTKTFKIQGRSSDSNVNKEGVIKNAYLVVLEMPLGVQVSRAYQYRPGAGNSSGENQATCSNLGYTTGNGNGWIWDTPFQSEGKISSGDWTFYINESDDDANGVGGIIICVWKITITSEQINSGGTLLVEYADTTPNTDLWNGGTSNVSYAASSQTEKSLGVGEYLYVEYWHYLVTAAAIGRKSSFYTGDLTGNGASADDPRIVTPEITIPENIVFLVAAVPFIPMMVLWMKKRKGCTT